MHLPSPPIFKQSINHWVSPYLSHVANDNRHDDAIDGHSFTEDNADNSNGKGGGWRKERRRKSAICQKIPSQLSLTHDEAGHKPVCQQTSIAAGWL